MKFDKQESEIIKLMNTDHFVIRKAEVKDFEKIGTKFEKILSKENIKKSERVQLLEKSFTKRELAILSLVAAMQASM